MRPHLFFLFLAFLFLFIAQSFAQPLNQNTDTQNLVQYVNPLVGTAESEAGPSDNPTRGNTQPGPVVPFGMISWGPNTISDHDETITNKYERDVGYNYNSHRMQGIVLTHISGAGCPNGGELPILPFVGTPSSKALHYQHEQESASAGYYQVSLENGANIELTAKERTGFARFTFQNLAKGKSYGLQFLHPSVFHFQDAQHFSGSVVAGNFCQSTNKYRIYFAGEVVQAGGKTFVDPQSGRLSYVAAQDGSASLEMKISISYISEKGALQNLTTESVDQGVKEDFESAHTKAVAAWESVLQKIRIESDDERAKKNFYTAMYHSLIHPNVQDDVSGFYRGYDNKVHAVRPGHRHYANFSGWDIYRSEVQLLAMLFPARASDMAESLVSAAEECGGLPQWALNHADTAVMIGDAGPIMVGDFYAFGADQFNLERAFHFMVNNATNPKSSCNGHLSRPGLDDYLKLGYTPLDSVNFGFVSTSMEYAMSDFAISRFAHALGKAKQEQYFLKQSGSWKNLWWQPSDGSAGYIRGKTDDGKWLEPFTPDHNPTNTNFDQGFVEGSSAQYSLMVPYDFSEVLNRLGDEKTRQARLGAFFSNVTGGLNAPFMHIGNENNFSSPWIYLWAGQPSATQEVVSRIVNTTFNPTPGGLPGNDDLGATSSWYIFATLGFYPVVPGEGGLAIHGPTFARAEIELENGKSIRIERNVSSPSTAASAPYIQSLSVNEVAYPHTWIFWNQLKDGAVLKYDMSNAPTDWASGMQNTPPSFH